MRLPWLQGDLMRAKQQWKKGLDLFLDEGDWEKLTRPFYRFVLGEQTVEEMRAVIESGVSTVALENILDCATILTRCSTRLEGIDEAVTMLKAAIK